MPLQECPNCHTVSDGDVCHVCGNLLGGAPAATAQTDGHNLALAAMIVGLASIVFAQPVSSIVAIVLGNMALKRDLTDQDRTFAKIGLVTGIVTLVLAIVAIVVLILVFSVASQQVGP